MPTKESLTQFLVDANKSGYASGDPKNKIKEQDGSTTILFEDGPWKSDDNYFGGEPYGGRIIVSHKGKPYWMMVYYGWVEEGVDMDQVYGVLQNALMQMPEDAPLRGPEEFEEGEFIYTNKWQGEIERYSGEEQITQNGQLIYKAGYIGGLVDQSK